jgi:hypothetical protein
MPAFLTNNTNTCCCPEMRCCAPNAVTAKLAGFAGTMVKRWIGRIYGDNPPVGSGILDLQNGMHACAYQFSSPPNTCNDYTAIDPQTGDYTAASIYPKCLNAQIVWPSIAFPQKDVLTNVSGTNGYICSDYLTIREYHSGYAPNEEVAERCAEDGAAFICTKPGSGADSLYYGPSTSDRVHMVDLNREAYVCHRIRRDLRPEFVATVNRSVARKNTDEDARIVFDVYCRRRWQELPYCDEFDLNPIIINLTCAVSDTPPEEPPEGSWYCIDYRCGMRELPEEEGGWICTQHKCTAHEGTVKPHLFPYMPSGNYSADISLVLVPDAYFKNTEYKYQGAKPQKAMTWRVESATVDAPGAGYSVGDFFYVNFDQNWTALLNGGEINVGFPENDDICFGYPLEWQDKYGYTEQGGIYYQRLRVGEVDGNGGIASLEVVPWYRTPEFLPGSCIDEIEDKEDKTPFFPAYTRTICHPNSVDLPGSGYRIGDTITFRPLSPDVVTYEAASARVIDVDENGGVLDWEVKGSDIWRYGFGMQNPECNIIGQPDERGAYRWPDVLSLCELYWYGVGNPVRAVSRAFDGFSRLDTTMNTGSLTSLAISILRVPCRTSISVVVAGYKYESLSFLADVEGVNPVFSQVLLSLCPPYPKCIGGGAQITPIIGDDGGNESAIGGPLTSGEVKSQGKYYAFIDKSHSPPTLPLDVPDIGSGTGAKILAFTFGTVANFPSPGYASGEKYVPSPARFAYYPVSGVFVDPDNQGVGYEIGQEFEVRPAGGAAFTDAWALDGGDNPDRVLTGSWYSGELTFTNSAGYAVEPGTPNAESRSPFCRLAIVDTTETGGIKSIAVLDGGMMFKPVYTTGVRHPDVSVLVKSDTGEGASAEIDIQTNKNSPEFGEVTAVDIVQTPVEIQADPLHSTEEQSVPYPLGGRDYANPPSGLMWEMNDIVAGSGATNAPARLISKINWHQFYHNPYHTNQSPYVRIEGGGHLPFRRRAEDCTLDECYHSLLNRQYPLYIEWTGINGGLSDPDTTTNLVDGGWAGCILPRGPNSYSPLPFNGGDYWWMLGRPKTNYALYRKAGTATDLPGFENCDSQFYNYSRKITDNPEYTGPASATQFEYAVVEWGFTVTLSAVIPVYPNCPDHEDGRTSK